MLLHFPHLKMDLFLCANGGNLFMRNINFFGKCPKHKKVHENK